MKKLTEEQDIAYRERINKAFTNKQDMVGDEKDYYCDGMDMYRFLVEAEVIKEEKHPYIDLFDKLFQKDIK